MTTQQDWISAETQMVSFCDKRLNDRYRSLLDNLSNSPNESIPAACKGWKETLAAYRFMNNSKVTASKILEPHKAATIERIKTENVVLIVQDTTEIDFSNRQSLQNIGYLSKETGKGFYLHPCVAFTPERCCLGVVDIQTWVRESIGHSYATRRNLPIEEKESYRWLKGYKAANEVAMQTQNTIVSVSDREGDIYELLEHLPSENNKAYWLVRCNHNRSILEQDGKKSILCLKDTIKNKKPIGEIEFTVPPGKVNNNSKLRHLRNGRLVTQEIRVDTVKLNPPHRKGKKLDAVSVNVVHCQEIAPPQGEQNIEWFLLTSYPINTTQDAINIVEWYLCRWQIEVFFKVLKSGCVIEELQFNTLEATLNCLAFYMIVSWRVMFLMIMGRHCPDICSSKLFDEDEWKAICVMTNKTAPPETPPKLGEMVVMIAKLGGFLARKSDGHPGPRTMWIGLQRMRDFTLAWETINALPG